MGVIFEFIFQAIFEVLFFYTGNYFLSFVTFGKYKLQKTPFEKGKDNINKGPSVFVGAIIWIGGGITIGYLLSF